MRTVVDPFTGEEWTETQPADEVTEPASWRAILAGALVLASVVFTFVVLPLL